MFTIYPRLPTRGLCRRTVHSPPLEPNPTVVLPSLPEQVAARHHLYSRRIGPLGSIFVRHSSHSTSMPIRCSCKKCGLTASVCHAVLSHDILLPPFASPVPVACRRVSTTKVAGTRPLLQCGHKDIHIFVELLKNRRRGGNGECEPQREEGENEGGGSAGPGGPADRRVARDRETESQRREWEKSHK